MRLSIGSVLVLGLLAIAAAEGCGSTDSGPGSAGAAGSSAQGGHAAGGTAGSGNTAGSAQAGNGAAGSSGSIGTSGSGGANAGSGGASGSAGSSGGTAGTSGSGGTAGTATAGTSGSGGKGGASGAGGSGGSAGTSGSGGSGGTGGAACNTVVQAAPNVTPTNNAGTPPTLVQGTIKAGTYYLTQETYYPGAPAHALTAVASTAKVTVAGLVATIEVVEGTTRFTITITMANPSTNPPTEEKLICTSNQALTGAPGTVTGGLTYTATTTTLSVYSVPLKLLTVYTLQ